MNSVRIYWRFGWRWEVPLHNMFIKGGPFLTRVRAERNCRDWMTDFTIKTARLLAEARPLCVI